jgi:hypothetical protein
LERSGVEAILLDQYCSRSGETPYLRDRLHWNFVGHALIARLLASRLRARSRIELHSQLRQSHAAAA